VSDPLPPIRTIQADAVWNGGGFDGPTLLTLDGDQLTRVGVADAPAAPDSAPGQPLLLGGTLFPSLTDHHTHLGLTDPSALLAGGITHAVDLGWIPEVAATWLADLPGRPSVAIAGALITAPGGYPVASGWAPEGAAAEVGGPREAREAVRKQVMLGASRIKVALNSDAGETVDNATLVAIVEESNAAGLPVVAHVQGPGQTARALEAGVDQLAHTPFTERLDDGLVAESARRGMTWISTLDIHGWGVPTGQYRIAVDNLRRFVAAGGGVLYGTDLGNGDLPVGVNARELIALQDAGVTGAALVRTIAGEKRAALGPRVAWVPTPPPADDRDVPAWLATARGVRVPDLPNLATTSRLLGQDTP
jgi:imidazolonepropionase-like amidohydrolase